MRVCEHPILRHSQESNFFENASALALSSKLTRLLRNTRKIIHASSRSISKFTAVHVPQLSKSDAPESRRRLQSSKRRRFRKSKRTHLEANSASSHSTLIHDRTGPNGVNLGRQTKPQKPRYKLQNSGPIREGQVVLGLVTTSFLSPKQLYRYKKTPIHWYFSSTITGISWSTQKTSILLHT